MKTLPRDKPGGESSNPRGSRTHPGAWDTHNILGDLWVSASKFDKWMYGGSRGLLQLSKRLEALFEDDGARGFEDLLAQFRFLSLSPLGHSHDSPPFMNTVQ